MATSTVSLGKLLERWRRGRPIPRGWAIDADGAPLTNGYAASRARRLTPLGGTPEGGSHKGYGLAVAVEILSAVLPGLDAEPTTDGRRARVGHFCLAIDPARFGEAAGFPLRMDALIESLRETPPLTPGQPVRWRATRSGRCWPSEPRPASRSRRAVFEDFAAWPTRHACRSCSIGPEPDMRRLLGTLVVLAYSAGADPGAVSRPRAARGSSRRPHPPHRGLRRAARAVLPRPVRARAHRPTRHPRGARPRRVAPILSRDQVRREPSRFLSTARRARATLALLTGGTTGTPLEVHHDWRSLLANIGFGERERAPVIALSGGGFRPKELHIGYETSNLRKILAFYAAQTRLPVKPRRVSVSMRASFEEIVAAINTEQPDVLTAYGGFLDTFFRTVDGTRRCGSLAEGRHVRRRDRCRPSAVRGSSASWALA